MSFQQIHKQSKTQTNKKDNISKIYDLSHQDNSTSQDYNQAYSNNNLINFNFSDISIFDSEKITQRKPMCICEGKCTKCKAADNLADIPNIQPKLKISQPDDPLEKEADIIAEQIVTMNNKLSTTKFDNKNKRNEIINRKCSKCEEEDHDDDDKEKPFQISRKNNAYNNHKIGVSNEITNQIKNVIESNGDRLNYPTRRFMKSRFGYDFSGVRIHTDSAAAKSANTINALAYTIDNHIIFGDGEYRPNTYNGRKLLAHELTHVVQQNGNGRDDNFNIRRIKRNKANPSLKTTFLNESLIQRQSIQQINLPIDSLEQAKDEASDKFPYLASQLSQVTLRAIVYKERTEISIDGFKNKKTYPSQILDANQGFYVIKWDQNGNFGPDGIIDLTTGSKPMKALKIYQIAGQEELTDLRANRIGIVWVTQSVTQPVNPPPPPPLKPDDIELPLSTRHEITEGDFKRESNTFFLRGQLVRRLAHGDGSGVVGDVA